jgi:hypothetical protein
MPLLGNNMRHAGCLTSFFFSHKSACALLMQHVKICYMVHVTLGIKVWRGLGTTRALGIMIESDLRHKEIARSLG